jgi:hypothetical protein
VTAVVRIALWCEVPLQRPSVVDQCYSLSLGSGSAVAGGEEVGEEDDPGLREQNRKAEVHALIAQLSGEKGGTMFLKAEFTKVRGRRGIRVFERKCVRTQRTQITLPFFPLSTELLELVEAYHRLCSYVVAPDAATLASRTMGGTVATPLLQTAKGCLANSESVRKLCNQLTRSASSAHGGSAELFKHLRRAGRQVLLSPGGLRLVTRSTLMENVAKEQLAKGMDHNVLTGERDYSSASSDLTQAQESAHALIQSWFIQAASMEQSLPSFLADAARKVRSLGDIAFHARTRRWDAAGCYEADPGASMEDATRQSPRKHRQTCSPPSPSPVSSHLPLAEGGDDMGWEPAGCSSDSDSSDRGSVSGGEGNDASAIACPRCANGKLFPCMDQLRLHQRLDHGQGLRADDRCHSKKRKLNGFALGMSSLGGSEEHQLLFEEVDSLAPSPTKLAQQAALTVAQAAPTTSTAAPPAPVMNLYSVPQRSPAGVMADSSCFALRPRSRGAPPQAAEVVELVGLVKARKVPGNIFRLRVRWKDRATTSIVGLMDVICSPPPGPSQPGRLPQVLVDWIEDAVSEAGNLEASWWAAQGPAAVSA